MGLLLAHVSHRVGLLVVVAEEIGAEAIGEAVRRSVFAISSVAIWGSTIAVGSSIAMMKEWVRCSFMESVRWINLRVGESSSIGMVCLHLGMTVLFATGSVRCWSGNWCW